MRCPLGSHKLRCSLEVKMTTIAKYNTSNIQKFFEDIDRLTIGMDPFFSRLDNLHVTNYPPFNVIDLGNGQQRLEIAVAGFSKSEISVYTENNVLTVSGTKESRPEENYKHHGIASRSFTRTWPISDDIRIGDVKLIDGLLSIEVLRIIPDHQKKRTYSVL